MAAGAAIAGGGGGRRGSATQTVGVLNMLTDLAFNLLIFFVVLASNEPETRGRPQQLPASKESKETEKKSDSTQITISRTTLKFNDTEVPIEELKSKVAGVIAGKSDPAERIVIVKNEGDTPYKTWIRVVGLIEQAGGIITLQLDEEKEVTVP